MQFMENPVACSGYKMAPGNLLMGTKGDGRIKFDIE
jgi:hypothetical protein